MLNPMLERVARALCVAADMDPDRPSNDERDAGKPLWMTYVGMARAAEEALSNLYTHLDANGATKRTAYLIADLIDAKINAALK